MLLESVRALKAEIAERVVTPRIEAGISNRAFGMAATAIARANDPVRAVALGIARSKAGDFRLAVRVQRRAIELDGALVAGIIRRTHGEVDIRYVGQILKQPQPVIKQAAPWHRARQRPLLLGGSVAHYQVTAGTIGAFVRRKTSKKLFLLSNNHVLANEDFADRKDPILQPGPIDGGLRRRDRIGVLQYAIRMANEHNLVDAAIASVLPDIAADPTTLMGLGLLRGTSARPLVPGDIVMKVGRTTNATRGIVTAIELDDVVINYERGALSFDRQIEIEGVGDNAFSAGGDSGSLIVNADLEAVGLLFAGGDQGGSNGKGLTYANPIAEVFTALNITLAT